MLYSREGRGIERQNGYNHSNLFLGIRAGALEHEWVELWSDCHRYVVGIDLRKQTGVTTGVAAIATVHLDMIGQQKGFLPTAESAWKHGRAEQTFH
jgi:hypothetical protein